MPNQRSGQRDPGEATSQPQAATPRRVPGLWEIFFVENMRRLRERSGMTQTDLAKILKERGLPFHQQTIQRIENGDRPIRLDEAYLVAEQFDVPLEAMTSAPIASVTELTLEVNRMVRNGEATTEGMIEHYEDFLTSVANLCIPLEEHLNSRDNYRDLPRWVQVGLAICMKAIPVMQSMRSGAESLASFTGDSQGETRPDEWSFVFPGEDLVDDIRRWIDKFNCQELRDLAQKSVTYLLVLATQEGEKARRIG